MAAELEAAGVGQARTRVDAQQRIVVDRVLLVRVMQVVRREQRQVEVLRQLEQVTAHAPLDVDVEVVLHQLAVEVAVTEDVAELRRGLARLVVLPQTKARLDLPRRAPRRADDAHAVRVEQLSVESRILRVHLVERGLRAHAEEVVHALVVLREQRHVRVETPVGDVVGLLAALAPRRARLVGAVRARRHVRLEADDRLHVILARLRPELVGTEQVPVVGGRDRRHAELLRTREHVIDTGCTVEHRVLGVVVQMDEALRLTGHRPEVYDRPPTTPPDARRPAPGASREPGGTSRNSASGADAIERALQVGRVRRGERHTFAATGVVESELDGVQPLTLQPELLRERRVGAVQRVADARMMHR